MTERHPAFDDLLRQARGGKLTRRQLLVRAAGLGLSTGVIGALLAACGGTTPTATSAPAAAPTTAPTAAAAAPTAAPTRAAGGTTPAATTGAAAAPTTAAAPAATTGAAPAAGRRGGAGQVRLLWWQGPTILNPHLTTGTKDADACRVVHEPLISFNKEDQIIPVLAAEVPSLQNGGLAPDGKSVTYKLRPGVKWSDGKDFTADDVVFTYEFLADPATAATTRGVYQSVEKVEKVDNLTVRILFKQPTPGWYAIFATSNGMIIAKHVFEQYKGAAARNAPPNLMPVGTNAYKVREFKPGERVLYEINPNYRDPNKPSFDTIELRGGGDATTAARAVFQAGEVDYAWNLQVDAPTLERLEREGGKGDLLVSAGNGTEIVFINQTDPNKEVDGEKSSLQAPHPFQTNLQIRQAYALLADRDTITKALYGRTGTATANFINAPQRFVSKNTKYEFNVDKANALLDEAGAKRGPDGTRVFNGAPLRITYSTSVLPLRQREQEIVKDGFEKAGIKVELKSVPGTQYFDGSAATLDNINHFYTDIQMYTTTITSPDPQNYSRQFLSTDIAQKSNSWGLANYSRYKNPQYDTLYQQQATEVDPEKRVQLFIQMNDLLHADAALVPLIYRADVQAKAKNINWSEPAPWESDLWDVASWTKK